MSDLSEGAWIIIGDSVQGAAHKRIDLPNQDAIWSHPRIIDAAPTLAIARPPVILAVSDGHGSPRSFRSDAGAMTAVQIAVERTKEFIDHVENLAPDVVRDIAQNRLPAEIVRSWKREVAQHFNKNPFVDEELRKVEAAVGNSKADELNDEQGFYVAYGATLLVVAITENFIIYLQLGDGDILVVSDGGESVELPIAPDTSMLGNETTSLCLPNAQNLFRSSFQIRGDRNPALIAVSTDGYSNSFADASSFQKIGPDFLKLIRTRGIDDVRRELGSWLNQASESGSGDDITLGLIIRHDARDIPSHSDMIGFDPPPPDAEGQAP
jgi:hypothetical protein